MNYWSAILCISCAFAQALVGVAAFSADSTIGEDIPFQVECPAGQSQIHQIQAPGAQFLTVHFARFNLPQQDSVIVQSPDGSTKYEYRGLGRGDQGESGGFYSSVIPGDRAIIEYVAATSTSMGEPSSTLGFSIDKYTKSIRSLLSVCGNDDSRLAKCYVSSPEAPEAYQRSRAIARMLVDGKRSCTGWLVGSEGHLMTNYHCVGNEKEAASVDIEFMAESPNCADDAESVRKGGYPGTRLADASVKIVASSVDTKYGLDYSLLKLNTSVDLSQFGHLMMRVQGTKEEERIYIPQHPRGHAKRIALTEDNGEPAIIRAVNYTSRCGANRLGYLTDTRGGSSGSPVLAVGDNQVVGLHHCGGCLEPGVNNAAVDIRSIIHDLYLKNAIPKDAIDEPATNVPEGPWLDFTNTQAPTPAPSLSRCRVFLQPNACKLLPHICIWRDGACVEIGANN